MFAVYTLAFNSSFIFMSNFTIYLNRILRLFGKKIPYKNALVYKLIEQIDVGHFIRIFCISCHIIVLTGIVNTGVRSFTWWDFIGWGWISENWSLVLSLKIERSQVSSGWRSRRVDGWRGNGFRIDWGFGWQGTSFLSLRVSWRTGRRNGNSVGDVVRGKVAEMDSWNSKKKTWSSLKMIKIWQECQFIRLWDLILDTI